MKKALISPIEFRGEGVRIAQVEDADFPVAAPLFWANCPDEVTTEWIFVNGEYVAPVVEEPVDTGGE